MIKIKPNTKTSISLKDGNLIPSSKSTRIEEYTSRPKSSAAIVFEIEKKTQNLFVKLSEIKEDLDIYLGSANDASVIGDNEGIITDLTYTSSTNFGTENEFLFAQLEPGSYYLDIRSNFGSQLEDFNLQNSPGVLTFDTKYFTKKLAKLPNDPLLTRQWHLFNKGSYALSDQKLSKNILLEDVNGILPNADIKAPEAWRKNHSASDVIVAVIDSGVDIDHADLRGNIWINSDEKKNGDDSDENGFKDDIHGWNFGSNNNNPRPSTPKASHGTHVAGIIGAEGNNQIGISGVAWNVQLMPLSVEDPTNPFAIKGANKALKYAVQNEAEIINMSFGSNFKISPAEAMIYMQANGSPTRDMPDHLRKVLKADFKLIKILKESNALAVIAAGNEGDIVHRFNNWRQIGSLDQSMSPSNFLATFFDNMMSISSSDGMMNLSPYTNIGLSVDLSAPGGNMENGNEFGILSTYPSGSTEDQSTEPVDQRNAFSIGGNDYGYDQGTSMAAPVVSGAAALIKATNPELSAADIRDVLMHSATKNPKLKGLAGQRGLQLNLDEALDLAETWEGKDSLYVFETGTEQDDQLRTTPDHTWFHGKGGNDLITGNHGDDRLHGDQGDDTLIPGEGRDTIEGGPGQDTITYNHEDESPIARPDLVVMESDDQLDLSALDGNPRKPGVQKLRLIDQPTFSGRAGELLARRNGAFVDLNGNGFADFGVLFSKSLNFDLTAEHFLL